uniref:Uncharacterized protein n=1 Tax=viral metagenome TaxID=1070528 RepID=A0A6C0HDI5_9ZZZZ
MCPKLLIIILFMIGLFYQSSSTEYFTEDKRLIYNDNPTRFINPSYGIALDVLQTGESGCGTIDWTTATPEQVSAYATCLNQMKRVAIKQLTGNVGASPN